jgi:hypothetical protein
MAPIIIKILITGFQPIGRFRILTRHPVERVCRRAFEAAMREIIFEVKTNRATTKNRGTFRYSPS